MTGSYWRKRELKNINARKKSDAEIFKAIESRYIQTTREIEKEINSFYGKYATKEGITMSEARKRVSKLDIDEYAKKAKRYVEGAHSGNPLIAAQSFTQKAHDEMAIYNLTMKVNRLELTKANMALELAATTSDVEHFLLDRFTEGAREEFARQSGILGMTVTESRASIEKIVNASFHNATWSERLWVNQQALKAELNTLLSRGILQGRNPKELARELKKKFDVELYEAQRLAVTEMARIQIDVAEESMKQAGYESYYYLAESGACEVCAPLDDGKPKKLKDARTGVNYPPMHPHCRCSVSPAFEGE